MYSCVASRSLSLPQLSCSSHLVQTFLQNAGFDHWCLFHHQPAHGPGMSATIESGAHIKVAPWADFCSPGIVCLAGSSDDILVMRPFQKGSLTQILEECCTDGEKMSMHTNVWSALQVNYFVMVLTIAVVLGFQDSTSLSSAYGEVPLLSSMSTSPKWWEVGDL